MTVPSDSSVMKDYLKKYMSGEDTNKKKKKKISKSTLKRSQIIDDDIDLKSMRPLDDDEVELYQMDEEAPQIAGIVDERPPELIAQEQYSSKRWKVFGGDDGVKIVDNMDKNQSVSDKLSVMSKEFGKVENYAKKGDLDKMGESSKIDTKSSKIKSKKENSTDISPGGVYKSSKKPSTIQKSGTLKKHMSSDSDESPKRGSKDQSSRQDDSDLSSSRNVHRNSNYDSDLSPYRSNKKSSNKDDSDLSPPRNDRKGLSYSKKFNSDPHPPRKVQQTKYDSDTSPPRKESKKRIPNNSDKYSLGREHKQTRFDSDNSLSRKNKGKRSKYKSDSDNSPPRKGKTSSHKHRNASDSDDSSPRIRKKEKRYKNKYDNDSSPPRRNRRKSSSDSDISIPRRPRKTSPNDKSSYANERRRSSRSNSPPLKHVLLNKPLKSNSSPRLSRRDLMDKKIAKRHFSDSDDSPPRRRRNSYRKDESASDLSPLRKRILMEKDKPIKKPLYKPNNSSSDETYKSKNKKMKTTLDGKLAGLQDAKQLRKELSDLRMKEDVMFSKLDASVSGIGAAAIKRDRKTGQVRDLEKEKEVQKEKDAKAAVVNEKYYKWGKGLKQVEDAAERAADALKEMSKPLARYADDDDLDKFLKAQEREGDPMLDYIKRKQSEATPLAGQKPIYKGSYNPNRFGIRPGHRWDGVVRSNGYEKEWFTHQNARKARDEDAYKWSTSDM